jgi:transcriptional regulator with XRE-family HTH domain
MKTPLREIRENKRLTQRDMADLLEISVPYYCRIENGKHRIALDTAETIAEILEVSLQDIDFCARKVTISAS